MWHCLASCTVHAQLVGICRTQLDAWSSSDGPVDLAAHGKDLSFEFSTQLLVSGRALQCTLSHCHTVTLSHCHTVTLSHCHTVTLSHCHTVTLSHCHTVTLSHCHTVTLSHCHTVTLSHCSQHRMLAV
jgi:hypothetical protein